jgi:hypothetical protein
MNLFFFVQGSSFNNSRFAFEERASIRLITIIELKCFLPLFIFYDLPLFSVCYWEDLPQAFSISCSIVVAIELIQLLPYHLIQCLFKHFDPQIVRLEPLTIS